MSKQNRRHSGQLLATAGQKRYLSRPPEISEIMKPHYPPLILASSSSYRRQLLAKLGLAVEARSPNIDERAAPGELPRNLALRLAREKARAVLPHCPEALIIASDQVADLNGTALGKPGTADAAVDQLRRCSGQKVHFHTALVLHNAASGAVQCAVDCTTVTFRELDVAAIRRYVEREPALDCAGAFKVEGLGIALFEAVDSQDPNSLVGLPLITLITMLKEENYPVL